MPAMWRESRTLLATLGHSGLMNSKQRESVAKYGYDISKGVVLLALVGAIGESNVEQTLQFLSGAAATFWAAFNLEETR